MKFKQFEICLADLNPKFGTESGKTRPVLIVQSNLLNKVHPSTIICPITTNVKEGVSILRGSLEKIMTINCNNFASGIYFINTYHHSGYTNTEKIIINH